GAAGPERLMAAIAHKPGIDALELRRRNLIPGAEMPYTIEFDEPGAEELILDSGDYPALLDKALAYFKWNEVLADVQRRRAAGEAVGSGMAMFIEESGRGPTDGAK